MRTILSVLLVISLLFLGITAISESAQQSKDTALNDSQASSDAYNMSTELFGGLSKAGGQSLVWGGIGAAILVALGVLVAAGTSGGR